MDDTMLNPPALQITTHICYFHTTTFCSAQQICVVMIPPAQPYFCRKREVVSAHEAISMDGALTLCSIPR